MCVGSQELKTEPETIGNDTEERTSVVSEAKVLRGP
jgi:hypothetical protein